MTPTAEPLRQAEEPVDVSRAQGDGALKPVPKSWKPLLASRADGSPVLVFVSPKVEAAIKEAVES